MKNFIVGMLIGVASGICVGAISVARNKNLAEKINTAVSSGEEKIKQFASKLKGSQKDQAEPENGFPCANCS